MHVSGFVPAGVALQVRDDASDAVRPLQRLADKLLEILHDIVDLQVGLLPPDRFDLLRRRPGRGALGQDGEELPEARQIFPEGGKVAVDEADRIFDLVGHAGGERLVPPEIPPGELVVLLPGLRQVPAAVLPPPTTITSLLR